MTVRQQWGVVLGVVALLAAGLFAATRLFDDELFPVTIGTTAPAFTAATLDATPRPRTLADYDGQVVLLNIWATWCAPCREEMPSIQALHETFGPKGLKVVAVSIDDAGAQQQVRDFVRDFGLTFEVLHEPSGAIQKTYQTTGVPESFLIGRDGVVRKKVFASNWNSPANRALVAQLLGVPVPNAPAAGTAPAADSDAARRTTARVIATGAPAAGPGGTP